MEMTDGAVPLKEVPHGGAKFRAQTLQVYKKQMNP